MNKLLVLSCLLTASLVHAETPPAAPARAATPVVPAAPKPAPAPAPAPARPVVVAPAAPAAPVVAVPGQAVAPLAPLTPEQRRQLELLANAERIDKANRELLAKNQELQLHNENLGMQINLIRHDKSSEGIWKGALAVIAGFLLGWFFATSSHRKNSW